MAGPPPAYDEIRKQATKRLPPMPGGESASGREAMPRARVLLADDNPAILDHARRLLSEEFEVVGAVGDGESVLRDYEAIKPDVVVLDISMGEVSGIEVARRLLDMGHQAKIIFLTVHEEAEYVCAAMGAGGAGYVLKSRLTDLRAAVHAVLAGRIFISPNLMQACYESG